MQLRSLHALLGPNVWSRSPVVAAEIELGKYAKPSPDAVAGLAERLLAALPAPPADANVAERGDLAARLRQCGSPVEAAACLAVQWQAQLVATPRGPALDISGDGEPGLACVIAATEDPPLTEACLKAALDLVAAVLDGRPPDFAAMFAKLTDTADGICLGPTTGTIARAARERGIPIRRLDDDSLVLLGHGCRQHRIRTAVTDRTGAIAQDIAQDKEVTKQLLRDIGVPMPTGRAVTSAADAWRAACEVGGPVVVKPRNANHGRGVAINLSTREQVERAYGVALPEGDGVLVEEFAVGAEHRVLVVEGRVVAASRAEPEQVDGDGIRTITELVDAANADPRRGENWFDLLGKIEIDTPARLLLEQQGYTPASIPPRGATVLIHYNGEFTTDVTDHVHPAVAAACVLAARVVGLNIAGIDLIARDISLPPDEQGARIIEVNAGPGLRMHFEPQHGKPRPVGEFIVDGMFTDGDDGRIPLVAVGGGLRSTNIARLVRDRLAKTRRHVGLACDEGLWVGTHRLKSGRCDDAASGRALLLHPDLDSAVYALPDDVVRRDGLPFDLCDAAVLTKADGDAEVRRVIVEALHPQRGFVVLEPGDAAGIALAERVGRRYVTAAKADDASVAAAVADSLH